MQTGPTVVSLFTGIGGLDLGLEKAGFQTRLCVENDARARETVRLNRPEWSFWEPGDAIALAQHPRRAFVATGIKRDEVSLLSGGPPCQPFSKAGNWTAAGPARMRDPRAQTIHAYLAILAYIRPEVLLFENVAGFAFKGRHQGLRVLIRGIRGINRKYGTRYNPQLLQINAADYGVPQLRERVFIVAHRLGRHFELPPPQHGPNSSTGERYRSAWDAIGDLDSASWSEELSLNGKWADLLPSIPEGQNYLWHTPGHGGKPLFGWRTRYWSFLLKLAKRHPAWTIPAQPGPATGPFHWRNRLLSVQEMCRLQTFPADYLVPCGRRIAQQQIGNAVPPALAEFLGYEIRRQLLDDPARGKLSLVPLARSDCPEPETRRRVPTAYNPLCGNHVPHPGTGLGPSRAGKSKLERRAA
jgi:DNA (cytosine-5)-methyltransferase 1